MAATSTAVAGGKRAANGIAVVDLSPLFAITGACADPAAVHELASQVRAACETVGCFYLAGVEQRLPEKSLAGLYSAVRAFFELPLEKKLLVKTTGNVIGRGYFPFESENVNAFMGRAGHPNDPVEKYGVGPVDPCPDPDYLPAHPEAAEWWEPNVWPEEPLGFRVAVSEYYRTMTSLAEVVMMLFSVALGMDPEFVLRHFDKGAHSLKLNYYPAVATPKEGQSRFPEHTDSPPFTLLTMDETKGALKVRLRDGNWTDADPIPGTVFVNIGDTMARWTNDKWVATPHRVAWPVGPAKERVSVAFFAVPSFDTKLTCIPSCLDEGEQPHYPPMTLHEYVVHKCRSMASAEPAASAM